MKENNYLAYFYSSPLLMYGKRSGLRRCTLATKHSKTYAMDVSSLSCQAVTNYISLLLTPFFVCLKLYSSYSHC